MYYGSGYEDVQHRKPSIENARRLLKWNPCIPLERSVANTLDFFLREAVTAHDDPTRPYHVPITIQKTA